MKYIWLGIKDYCRDCWHDFWYWFWDALWTWTNKRCVKCYVWRYNEGCYTKEGSVRHYIEQRKIAKQIKDEKNGSKNRV